MAGGFSVQQQNACIRWAPSAAVGSGGGNQERTLVVLLCIAARCWELGRGTAVDSRHREDRVFMTGIYIPARKFLIAHGRG